MTLHTWSYFALTELLLCLAPGPAVLFVIGESLGGRTARSLSASGGVLAANALYFTLSAAGLNVILAASARLFLVVKIAGAAYLIYLGVRAVLARNTREVFADASAAVPDGTLRRGLVLQLSNPKAVLFFTALLPQFVSPRAPVASQILVLGMTSMTIEFLVLIAYGSVAARGSRMFGSGGAGPLLNAAGGLLLIGAGAGIAVTRNP